MPFCREMFLSVALMLFFFKKKKKCKSNALSYTVQEWANKGGGAYIRNNIFVGKWMGLNLGGWGVGILLYAVLKSEQCN